MKRKLPMFLALALFAGTISLFPCDITMKTARAPLAGKNRIQVKLIVECIHKRCPLSIEKTKLTTAGLTIEKQGQWKKNAAGAYEMDLIVFLNGKENGEIRVLRECPKTGCQEETLEVKAL
jgi:hypothetical protein